MGGEEHNNNHVASFSKQPACITYESCMGFMKCLDSFRLSIDWVPIILGLSLLHGR